MALPLQGTNVLDAITSHPILGTASLVLVGHSLGGLVIKTALANATNHGVDRYEAFSRQVKGIVFIGTPHFGSELANLASAIRFLRPNEQVVNLKMNDSALAGLNAQFRNLSAKLGIKVRGYSETRGVSFKRRVLGFQIWPSAIVVCSSSSDSHVPGEVAIPLPEDHFSICKPKNRDSQIHMGLLHFIRDLQEEKQEAKKPQEVVNAKEIEATDAWLRLPTPVFLAISRTTIGIERSSVETYSYVSTDDPEGLSRRISEWRAELTRDPLISVSVQKFAASAALVELVKAPPTRQRTLDWLTVTPFSAYVYYSVSPWQLNLSQEEVRVRLQIQPLVHRLSKHGEVVTQVNSELDELESALAQAIRFIAQKYHREIQMPQMNGRRAPNLAELAQLVSWATADHIARPDDEETTLIFNALRSRIRYAENVVTGSKHTRDKNPLH